jgi:hypothetical protein
VNRERIRAAATTIALCLAVLSPLIPADDGKLKDDFPLTWYPMFRGVRPSVETLLWVRASLADQTTRPVPVGYWTRGGMSEGRAHLDRAVAERDLPEFCAFVARELGRRRSGWAPRVMTLEVVRTRWRLETYFTRSDAAPLNEKVLHTCRIER